MMPSITKQIMSGAKWTSISTMCITIIQIVQFALLGNMMTLTEFGLVGMITTVTVFAQIVLDMGLYDINSERRHDGAPAVNIVLA